MALRKNLTDPRFYWVRERLFLASRTAGGAPAAVAAMSSDGKKIATLQYKAISFIDPDGQLAVYRRWTKEASLSGLTWVDDQTVALLSHESKGHGQERVTSAVLSTIRSDGTVVSSRELGIAPGSGSTSTGELAVSPDGQHIVISYGDEVHFLDGAGKVIASATTKDAAATQPADKNWLLVQPTFTPDSKRVAFKRMLAKGDVTPRTAEIVFFSPEGKELSSVAIPAIEPGTTRPAEAATQAASSPTQPASGPASKPAKKGGG